MTDEVLDDESQMQFLQLLHDSGCKFLFRTVLFEKEYVWVKDKYGSIFLERMPELQEEYVSVGPLTVEELEANAQ